MKVIDKRKEKHPNDCQVGDVICFWNYKDSKRYGLIVELAGRYYVALLSDSNTKSIGPGYLSDSGWWAGTTFAKVPTDTSVSVLVKYLSSQWDHVEKVNAHLVVED